MKPGSLLLRLAAFAALMALPAAALAVAVSVKAGFEDLGSPPPLDGATGLFYANGDSSSYQGIVWDGRFRVVGDANRVDPVTPGPLFGIPHSGHYFVTNEGDGAGNDGLLITTPLVLTGAWFGRNEYYGFGAGSDQVTIRALHGAEVLASVVFDLPVPAMAGQPGEPAFVNTQDFRDLVGITGYRIDRRETGELNGNWVADDFTFETAAVPEPAAGLLLLAGLGLISSLRRASSGSPARSGRPR